MHERITHSTTEIGSDHLPEGPHRAAIAPVSVDVLIVAYNSADVLRDSLASIQRHRPRSGGVDLRVHVYDNASTDGTAETVSSEFPEVVLHRSQFNAGFGAANNQLARGSDADFLLLLNPDTIWECDVVTPLLTELRRHPGAVLAGPKLVYPDGRLQLSSQLFPGLRYELAKAIRGTKLSAVPGFRSGNELIERVLGLDRGVTNEPREAEFIWATCWLIESRWVEEHGLFDERFPLYDEDLDFCFRLRGTAAKALYVPGVALVHIGGASSNEQRKLALMQDARARYYRANHGVLGQFIYRHVILPIGRFKFKKPRRSDGR